MNNKELLLASLTSKKAYNKPGLNYLVLLFLVFMLFIPLHSFAQTKKVSLNVSNGKLSEVFDEIKRQTGYSFFYNEKNIEKHSSISVSKANISTQDILSEILAKTSLTYVFVEDVIIIKYKVENQSPQQGNPKKTIRGVIFDNETGERLSFVSIADRKGLSGSVSNNNGEFQLLLPTETETVIVSSVGYEKQELNINGATFLNIKLKPTITSLQSVVVTGYQVVDKRELTSSISSIKAENLELTGSLSIDKLLEGKATGLMVTNLSSTPGAAAKIRIRSGSTFTGNQSPLWVIDGVIYEEPVPLTADEINSFDNINIIGNALTGINPQDIAQIDVLKDASATAIYGTRAANGVIVITTKRGKEGQPSLNYTGSMSYVQATRYSDLNLMNSKDRIDVSREMYNRNIGFSGQYKNVDRLGYEGALMNLWDKTYNYEQFQQQVSYLETLNSDWFGALYQPAITQQHSLSASGGTSNARYYLSFGYDDQQGTERGVGLNRITARSNIDLDIRKNLLLSFKISGSIQEAQYNHTSLNAFNEAYYISRTVPVYEPDGNYFFQSREIFTPTIGADRNIVYGGYNILKEMDNSERNISNKDFSVTATLNWSFLKYFKLNSMVSYRNTTNLNEEWITEDSYYVSKLRTYENFNDLLSSNLNNGSMVSFGGVYSAGMVSQESMSLRNQLNYNQVFGSKHVLNINLGQEVRSTSYWGATGFTVPGYNHYQGRGFIALPPVSFSPSTNQLDFSNYDYEYAFNWLTSSGSQNVYPTITDKLQNSVSLFGIINYVYDNRYVVNFNMRSDGSNTFGQYERYKFKPTWSASTRWNIHNEKFFNTSGIFDELALRASYGLRGTMPNATPYLIIANYGRNLTVYGNENVAQLSEFPNANLRWEKTETLNTGINYSLFKGRISGVLDYAYSKSTDLLQIRPVSLVNGTATQAYNSGSKDVSNYEFSIRTVNIKKDNFAWSTTFNFSYDYDRVLKGFEDGAQNNLTVNDYLYGSIHRKGFPSNGFFSYRFNGLNNEGLPTFQHLNEPSMSAEEQLKEALVYEGSRVPLYYGGFGTEFKYGSFRLSASFTYKLGHKIRLLNLYNGNQNLPLPYENMHSDFKNRWRNPGDEQNTTIPALTNYNMLFTSSEGADGVNLLYVSNYGKVVPQGKNAWWMYDYSDARVVEGDHIRLQTVTFSYNLPNKLLKKVGIKSMNISVVASNLAVWAFDKRLTGQDPEQVNGIGMPSLPTYSGSLNLSF